MSNWTNGSSRAWRRTRALVLRRDGYTCQLRTPGICTTRADLSGPHAGHAHHTRGRDITGDDPSFIVASCAACNLHAGSPAKPGKLPAPTPGTPRHVLSLSLGDQAATVGDPVALTWDPARLVGYEWLRPFLVVPENAAPPWAMSPPPPDAVGSYGAEAVEWVESTQRIRLRWWQALAITRQLEHREDGSLCHRVVVESTPRRAGKSTRIRGLALWRMAHPDLFGEVQTVIHTGSDVAICREIQRGSWLWAEEIGWRVGRSNGKEALETPTGDRWLVRAQQAVYGYDVCFGIVDEGWNVSPDTVSEGLEPATLERSSAQLHLTSTAHRRATSLMRSRLQVALTTEDEDTLLLLWAAPPRSDPGDPSVWRAASPHWSEDRRRMIADKYAKALAGKADPQADDPDPMAGFTSQYLNVWQLRPVPADRGDPVMSADAWAGLVMQVPTGAPDAAAVEGWFGDGVSLALAWKVGDRVMLSVQDLPDLSEVDGVLKAAGFEGVATIGASLLGDPALVGVRARKGQGRTGAAVQELRRLLAEDVVRHDGGEHLTEQVLSARTMPGADGPRMASTAAADAIKAAVWAVTDGRHQPPPLVVLRAR